MLRKILIVDDNEVNRKLLRKMLEDEYEVLEAADGRAALDVLKREPDRISAVLLDLVMPVMDGYEVLTQMRMDEDLASIPVIVATGDTDAGTEVKSLALGANDFVTKPYRGEIIRHRLWNTINLRETAAMVNAAKRDELTGLYNRRAFFNLAEEMLTAHEPGYYILACFDVDNFKVINDQYGSERGDQILRALANIFRSQFEPAGGICCRITADNFAILYPASLADGGGLELVYRLASRPDDTMQPISFSIGRYLADNLSVSVSTMYDRAVMAKAEVKGRYDTHVALYDAAMRESLLREQRITSEMTQALKTRQFEIWFQPQFNHASGTLTGAEALVRWNHPEWGLTSPGVFIPVFERNGFIFELDQFVWEEACRFLHSELLTEEKVLPLSVNISRCDLFHGGLREIFGRLIQKYDIPVELLRLEITESAFASAPERIITQVEALNAAGFIVEIDDFGSGYSSLNTLKDVPASVLKLDMRFLENGRNSARGGNILESVVRMAKWLDMQVIAEGVETVEQAEFLKSIGCCYVQGYLYARPLPEERYRALLRRTDGGVHLTEPEKPNTLDTNAFWDPRSMETLIFNNYPVGTSIFEYCGGAVEMIRVNDQYARELELEDADVHDLSTFQMENCLDGMNLAIARKNLEKAALSGEKATCEIWLRARPGKRSARIRSTVRVIAKVDNHLLLYNSVLNLTALRESEDGTAPEGEDRAAFERLKLLTGNIPGGIAMYEASPEQIRLICCNDGYYSHTGYSEKEYRALIEKKPLCLIFTEDQPRVWEALRAVLAGSDDFAYQYRLRAKNGECQWMDVRGCVVERRENTAIVNVVKFDVTQQMREDENLRIHSEELKTAMSQMGKTICEYDPVHRVLTLPAEYAVQAGVPNVLHDAPETLAKMLVLTDSSRAMLTELFEAIERGEATGSGDIRRVGKNGQGIWEHIDFASIFRPDGKAGRTIASIEDVTSRREAEQSLLEKERLLHRQAETDGMTGLYNKTTTENLIRRQLTILENVPCVLIVGDLDNLKNINDTLGHGRGDEAICRFAAVLHAQFRQTDIVGRIGGDEFAVFLENIENEVQIRHILTALLEKMAAVRFGESGDMAITGSFGVTFGRGGKDTYEKLFCEADRALYCVKRSGKNSFAVYTPEMEQDAYAYEPQETEHLRAKCFDSVELDPLMRAVSKIYSTAISINLTRNTYCMMQYGNHATLRCVDTGSYDDLVEETAESFAPGDRADYLAQFSRRALLSAREDGTVIVSREGRRKNGSHFCRVRTDAVFIGGHSGGDALAVLFTRELF